MRIFHRKYNIGKKREKIGSGTLHGSILEGLGRLLDAIGALLGAMIAFLGRSWALLGRLFGLMGASDLIGGGVWEALGRFLGGFGEYFERILGRFWEDIFVSETPALPRQLAWRHNARGSRTPRVLDFWVQVVPCLLVERSSSERASRIPSSIVFFFHWGAKLGQVGSKLAPRSLFLSNFFARCFEVAFFSVFRWFSDEFWEVWGWIWECFGKVSR